MSWNNYTGFTKISYFTKWRYYLLFLVICSTLIALNTQLQAQENSEFKLAVGLYNDGMFDLAAEQLKNFVAAYPSTSQGIVSPIIRASSRKSEKSSSRFSSY